MNATLTTLCPRCHGEGQVESNYIGSYLCPTCKGTGAKLCECGCPETDHADEDYDGGSEGYVACPRPCLICNCQDFWRAD